MNVQDAANLTIPEGSVRNIHDKDKRLLWSAVGYNVRYDGDTTQQTYSGKNLINPPTEPKIRYGVTFTPGVDGTITMNGTSTSVSTFAVNDGHFTLPAGTYTLSANNPVQGMSGYQLKISYYVSDSFSPDIPGAVVELNGTVNATKTFTTTEDLLINSVYMRLPNGTTVDNFTIQPQLEAGSTATSFEPYVGGIPAPNPDYPQTVNVVTGTQTVTVTGKNLLKLGNNNVSPSSAASQGATITINDNSIRFVATGTNITQYAYCFTGELDPNKQYVLSGAVTKVAQTSTARVNYSYSDDGTTWASNTSIFNQQMSAGTTATFSRALSGHKYYRFGVYNSFGATVIGTETYYYDIQIEESSTATDYEPYQSRSYTVDLGSTELCKLGAYQDYIYKSGDDWYVHKATGKVLLDGSDDEKWILQTSSTTPLENRWFEYRFLDIPVDTSYEVMNLAIKIDKFATAYPSAINYTTTVEGFFVMYGTGYLRVRWDMQNIQSVTSFRTWLSSNELKVYYPLATTTDTQITDSTLVAQLEAIHDWLRRYDYYGVVSGNLPIIINRSGII